MGNLEALTMPLDKFGRHMLRTRLAPYSSPQLPHPPVLTSSPVSSPFYICEPSSHHSKCVINIRGRLDKSQNILHYTLENQTDEYKSPIFDRVEHIEITPIDSRVLINDDIFTIDELVGKIINKGDTFIFPAPKKVSLYVEIVLQCPITKDD